MKRILILILLAGGLLSNGSNDSFAQVSQKVKIEKGKVFVNGTKQADEKLPVALRTLPSTSNFSFVSSDGTFLKLAGHYYKVDSDRLMEVDGKKIDPDKIVFIYSTGEKGILHQLTGDAQGVPGPYRVQSGDRNVTIAKYMASMNEKAEEFDNIRFKIDALHAPETAELALELKVGAENVARMAESFPKVQFEAYLADIQDADNMLYVRLVKEQEMEMETHHLAMKIQAAKTRAEQEKYTAQLRESLNQIFQLKQENRQKEIEQLTAKLNDLEKRMKERESLKKDIVENRIKELLDQYRW